MTRSILMLLFLIISFSTYANNFCTEELESLPIQQKGRIKPLRVHARESIKFLTGKYKFKDKKSVTTYCGLAAGTITNLTAKIEHVDLKKMLNLDNNYYLEYNKLGPLMGLLKTRYFSLKESGSLKKAIEALLHKIEIYKKITNGSDWFIPQTIDNKITWVPYSTYSQNHPNITTQSLLKERDAFVNANSDHYLTELTYSKLYLSHFALMFVLIALFTSVLLKKLHVALTLSVLALIAQTAILIFRTMISERAPITNMYESVLFSGYGGLILAMILGHFKKDKILLIVGLSYNVCTLFMINFANNMLPSSIGPLVPVLRDNFWLSTHVTTIIISYGALALSWVLANIVLIKRRFLTLGEKDNKYYSDLIYLCLKYGTVSLAAGIILGGIWADYSWGRFWGWDPKETWSLIVLCIYMAIIHGKYSSWIKPNLFIPLTAGAFMSVMMAWFGVNYILASGLHSYGFSQGGAIFLFTFFAVQILILSITWKTRSQNDKLVS